MEIVQIDKTYNHITLDEIKKHLHIATAYTDDDDYLTGLVSVATDIVENDTETNIALSNKTASKTLSNKNSLIIPDSNLSAVDSVEIDGVSGITYTVDEDDFNFTIQFDNEVSGEVVIDYSVGYTSSTIKPVLKQCILIKLMGLYDNERSEYNSGNFKLNTAYSNMINYYKKIVFI